MTLEELELIVRYARDKEERLMKFYAAFKGVDLDAGTESNDDRFEEIKKRAEARLNGKTDEDIEREVEYSSLTDLGIEVEID